LSALEILLDEVGVDVVGAVTSAEEAMALIDEKRPDLLMADLRLKGGASGVACVREALKRLPDLVVVVVSGFDDPGSVEEALSAGADAFVSKAANAEDFASAVRQVFSHSFFLASEHRSRGQRTLAQSGPVPGLTRRESEILELVAKGYSNGQVAEMLWVTEQTVKFHLSNIYRKLGVANRTQATHWTHMHAEGTQAATESLAAS
jgi:DNA-binding NarL/FixJ family response regulator